MAGISKDEKIQRIYNTASEFQLGSAPYIKMLDDGLKLTEIIDKIVTDGQHTVNELNKRKEEFTVLAESRGLDPAPYLELLEKGYMLTLVHEKLTEDAKKAAENSQEDSGEVVEAETIDNTTQEQNTTEGGSESQATQVKKWRITCKMTFSDKAQAQAFGEWMKSNDVDYEKVTKWEQC